MKTVGMAACLGAILFLLSGRALAQSPVPFSLTITAPQTKIKMGSELVVNLVLTNNSKRVAALEFTGPLCDYIVQVLNSDGELVPDAKVKSESDCVHEDTLMDIILQLKPNESTERTIPVTMFSDMSQPGEYSVQVMWTAPKGFGGMTVKSNTIKVTVTP